MKRKTIFAHLSIPALFAAAVFTVALTREPFGLEMFSAYLFGGFLFYATPHLLWLIAASLGKFSNAVWHAGFISCSAALAMISAFWLFPGDPSGLPMQWSLYWPLAILLLFIIPGTTAAYRRNNAPNNTLKTDAQ